jgi:Zn-dependent M28 family amino/carboxypeptidase
VTLQAAELVFVGFGIVAPEYGWNDYAGADVAGKVVMVMNNDPEDDPALFGGKTRLYYGRWDYKYEEAARQGAAGAIVIHTTPSAGYGFQVVQANHGRERFSLPQAAGQRLALESWATEEASRDIAKLGGHDLDALRQRALARGFQAVPLGVRLDLAIQNEVTRKQSANVIGRLPGRDPALAAEAVLYTAHHDHLGRKPDAEPGSDAIYNGALDNASGVAGLLAIAKAFSSRSPAPRRSVLFATVGAEEQGLLGSEYLAAHPPVAPGRLAANINIDGLNVIGPTRDITVIGHGKSSLDGVIEEIARVLERTVVPDQFPDRGFFYRSDQFNLARIGVPASYFDSGTDVIGKPPGWGREQAEKFEAERYHQPSDEIHEGWNLEGAVRDVRFYFHLGDVVANADAKPTWNPGDEFEAARLEALAAVAAD